MATREVFWNINFGNLVYILAIIAIAIWFFYFYKRIKLWLKGREDNRSREILSRIPHFIRTLITDIIPHRKFFYNPFTGLMHFLIFWGFVILLLASAVDAITYYTNHHLVGSPYLWFSLISDIGGFMVFAGMVMAAYRRYIKKPEGLDTIFDDGIVISSILIIIVTGYVIEGLRQAVTEIRSNPEWAIWSPGGYIFAKMFSEMNEVSARFWHRIFWWFHSIITVALIIYCGVVFSKFQHVIVSLINTFFRNLGPIGSPSPIDIEKSEILGAGEIKDFTWKQLLDLDACTNCGRCENECPAWATEKPLSPRKLIQDLKTHMVKTSGDKSPLIGEAPNESEIWSCTTCGACEHACPVYVEHIVKIIDLRRNLMLVQSKMPETAQIMLRNMQQRGHPWTGAQSLRLRGDWAVNLDIKILSEGEETQTLFWVGCTGALCERNVTTTISMARILKAVGKDFAVLGESETCCGDPARRSGYEFQFQIMAEQNIEIFKNYNIKEIITICPHCYNIIKNEYPLYGGKFNVIHYTQLIYNLIKDGRLNFKNEIKSKFTYHDPCYLGRYNGIYNEPRQIIQSIPGAKYAEMENSKGRSFCCGGGGGHMWIEEIPSSIKINQKRIEDVIKTGADTLITSCPYCLQMFEEAVEQKGIKESLKVKDLIEVIEPAVN